MADVNKTRLYLTYLIPFTIIWTYLDWVILPDVYDDREGSVIFYILFGIPFFTYLVVKAVLSKLKEKLLFAAVCTCLWLGLLFIERPLTSIGLKLRIHVSQEMSDCAKNGIQLEDHTVFAVCQFKRISTGMNNTRYAAIIYDTTDWDSDAQKKFREDVEYGGSKYEDNVHFTMEGLKIASVERITGDYYRVVF